MITCKLRALARLLRAKTLRVVLRHKNAETARRGLDDPLLRGGVKMRNKWLWFGCALFLWRLHGEGGKGEERFHDFVFGGAGRWCRGRWPSDLVHLPRLSSPTTSQGANALLQFSSAARKTAALAATQSWNAVLCWLRPSSRRGARTAGIVPAGRGGGCVHRVVGERGRVARRRVGGPAGARRCCGTGEQRFAVGLGD